MVGSRFSLLVLVGLVVQVVTSAQSSGNNADVVTPSESAVELIANKNLMGSIAGRVPLLIEFFLPTCGTFLSVSSLSISFSFFFRI